MARILIVEDEPVIAFDLKMTLINLKHEVCAISYYGEDAILKAETFLPDLVLMDIKLDENMDGIEAAERIQNNFNIPVIFITAYADKKTMERVKKVNPYGYFLKPFDERELQVNLALALHKHKPNENLNQEKTLTRNFEFPESLFPAGLSLLSHLSSMFHLYFPDDKIRINFIIEYPKIRLQIEIHNSEKEKVNRLLVNTGLLIQDKVSPEKFFRSSTAIMDYYHQLEIVKLLIERSISSRQKTTGKYKNITEEIKKELIWLKNHIGIILKYSENNLEGLKGITIDTLESQGNKNPDIIEKVDLLQYKLQNGLFIEDEKDIKVLLKFLKTRNLEIFRRLSNFIMGLIIKSTVTGLTASLIYKWLREV
ncbi:MAG: response regulator [Candidatus Cloacimonetes bacterium]|nr:response regulator [Candidatus Cloacimonadota bacterium]